MLFFRVTACGVARSITKESRLEKDLVSSEENELLFRENNPWCQDCHG